MPELLEQSEIDALLAAVEPGKHTDAAEATNIDLGEAPLHNGYDFRRPERVSKDHIRALGAIHDSFARNFAPTLSGFFRTIVEVRVISIEQLTYGEFIHSLPNPTCFVTLLAPPLEGQMCLEFSPLIVFPLVDRLLGGGNAELYVPQRPLTSIEWRLMQRLIDRALEHLSDAWRNLIETRFQTVETESNPQLVHVVAPSEVVVFITFEIKLGSSAGTMSMCIPFNTIESLLSKLTTQSGFGHRAKGATELQQKRLMRNLSRTTVEITTYLGETRIRLSELRSLAAGDVIQLDKRVERPLIVQIGGRNKFAANAGKLRGRRAARIVRAAAADEPL